MTLFIALSLGTALAADADCTHIRGESIAISLRGNVITTPGIVPDDDCASIEVPEGAVVTPAFIHASSVTGLTEVSLEAATNDANSGLSGDVHAAFSPLDAYNPLSSLIPITRMEGVGTVVVAPGSGFVAGQAMAFDLVGSTQAAAVAKQSAAMVANLGSGRNSSRADGLYRLRELLDDARFYRRQARAYEQGRLRELSAGRLDLQALQPVLRKETPLLLNANRASDIEAILRFAEEEDVRVILQGGAEAWMHAEALAAAKVPVLINPLQYGVSGFDSIHARPDNAALLEAAGVLVVIVNLDFRTHNARKLRQVAGNAVREGMTHQGALNAITTNVAEAFGLPHHGQLAPGHSANVVIWSGDPLEISSKPLHMWIQGQKIDLRSRQTELLEKYRELGAPQD